MSRGSEPRRRPRPRTNNHSQVITVVAIIVVGGLALGLITCCGVGFALYAKRGGGGGVLGSLGGADLSESATKRVALGMTLPEVEEILGEGRQATQRDLDAVNDRAARFRQGTIVSFQPGMTKYVWKSGNQWYFGDFDDRTKKLTGTQQWGSSN